MLGSPSPTPVDGIKGMKCPMGSYCPAGTSLPIACLASTFNNRTGLYSINQCTQCSPGMYCLNDNLTTPTGPCAERYYCSRGAKVAKPQDSLFGGRCSRGHYCPSGSQAPVPCEVSRD